MKDRFSPEALHERRVKRLRFLWARTRNPCRLCGSKESPFTHWCQGIPTPADEESEYTITPFSAERFQYPWVAHQSGRGNWVVDGRCANTSDAERIARRVRQRTKRKTVIVEAATRNQLQRVLDGGSLI